jgi:hypothetical protein
MKSTVKLFVALALVLAAFSQYTATRAAPNYAYTLKGLSAEAAFVSTDPSGCVYTGAFVYGLAQALRSPQSGAKKPSPQISVSLYQYNACTNVQLLSAHGDAPLGKQDFEVAGNLENARLAAATVHMFDYASGTPFDISVDLTWKAISPLGHQNSHYSYNFQGCHIDSRYEGTFRFSQASGTVSDGSTNFTSSASTSANVNANRSGEVASGCE